MGDLLSPIRNGGNGIAYEGSWYLFEGYTSKLTTAQKYLDNSWQVGPELYGMPEENYGHCIVVVGYFIIKIYLNLNVNVYFYFF